MKIEVKESDYVYVTSIYLESLCAYLILVQFIILMSFPKTDKVNLNFPDVYNIQSFNVSWNNKAFVLHLNYNFRLFYKGNYVALVGQLKDKNK